MQRECSQNVYQQQQYHEINTIASVVSNVAVVYVQHDDLAAVVVIVIVFFLFSLSHLFSLSRSFSLPFSHLTLNVIVASLKRL